MSLFGYIFLFWVGTIIYSTIIVFFLMHRMRVQIKKEGYIKSTKELGYTDNISKYWRLIAPIYNLRFTHDFIKHYRGIKQLTIAQIIIQSRMEL